MQYTNETQNESTDTVVDNEIDIEIEIEETNRDQEENESGEGDETEEKSSRFKDGEKIFMIRVRFPGNAKSFPFFVGKRKFAYGQKVVAMSDRGMTVGYINSFPYEVEFNKGMLPIRSIAKVATDEDIRAQKDFRDSEKKAEVICLRLIEKYKLEMVLTHVEFIQFGKKAVFYFNAPERVDFRELVKDLVADLKMRIELRQISVRDRAAALGAVGACGLQTCCSSFLKNYGNVSIKMAKNQNLALIPSKLNGVCGQIKCCIKYEDDVYADKRKLLPREQSIIKAKNGDIGKVLKLHLLVEQFEMLTDFGAKRRYSGVEFIGEDNLPTDYKFPETFDHIVDETREVIGLVKEAQKIAEHFIDEMDDEEDDDLYLDDGTEDGEEDENYDADSNSAMEEELNSIEGSVKKTEHAMKDNSRPNQNNQPRQHNNQNRDNRNHNNNRPNNQQGGQSNQGNRDNRNNNQNRNNDRNFKPRHNNQNSNNQNNNNQQRTDRPNNNQNRDNRNNNQNRPNNQQGGQGNQNNQANQGNRDNRNNQNRNNDRNFKPRHNNQNNNQTRPNGGNQNQNNNSNKEQKEIKKPE